MSTPSDLEINRAVRRLFVRHWIDLGRISVRTVRGKVLIYGKLQRIEGRKERLHPASVDAMFYDMRHMKGVRSVGAHLDNWSNDGGRFRPTTNTKSPDGEDTTRAYI